MSAALAYLCPSSDRLPAVRVATLSRSFVARRFGSSGASSHGGNRWRREEEAPTTECHRLFRPMATRDGNKQHFSRLGSQVQPRIPRRRRSRACAQSARYRVTLKALASRALLVPREADADAAVETALSKPEQSERPRKRRPWQPFASEPGLLFRFGECNYIFLGE